MPIRGARRLGRSVPFLSQLSRVVARIGSAEVPDVWGVILTCGGLFALHKLDLENQAERARAGLEPSVRPVNVGCCLLKWGLKLALLDDRVQVAIKRMQHIQKGFAKRGTETVAHLMRALAEKGYATLATDFTNGFNSLSRQKMLDAVQERCPELTQLFNTFYARDSMCFFPVGDDVHVIWSMEGSRMGCALGSLGFDFTVQPLYELMLSTYAEFVIEALTDDLTLAARLTAGDPEENVGVLRKLQGALTLLHKEAKRLNLQLKLSKCALYLPSAAGQFLLPAPAPAPLLSSAQPMISDCILAGALRVPLTPTHLQSQTLLLISSMLHAKDLAQLAVCSRSNWNSRLGLLLPEIRPTAEGLRIAGAPVGTDDFCKAFVHTEVRAVFTKLKRIHGIHPQVGMLLLRRCGPIALNFLAQVTPSHFTLADFAKFDDDLATFVYNSILALPNQPPPLGCSENRFARFKERVRLPLRHRGCGMASLALTAPAAFFSSVMSAAAEHPSLRVHLDGLKRFSAGVMTQIKTRFGPVVSEDAQTFLDSIFPEDASSGLVDPAFYVDLFTKKSDLKLQRVLSVEV
jgi:hypothetical protein